MRWKRCGWPLAILANIAIFCVLGFHRTTSADTPPPRPPMWANPLEQNQEIIEQLKTINRLLQQQNDLLQSGRLRVVVKSDKQE